MLFLKALCGCVPMTITKSWFEGSGFVVNEEGYVLTNAHLLEKAEGLTVLSLKTGAEVVAQRVFASRDMNLACCTYRA